MVTDRYSLTGYLSILYIHSETFFSHIDSNIMINLLPADLIKNFMTHSRIQFPLYVFITGPSHSPHCLCKMAHIDQTGILGPAYKQYRHIWICTGKMLHIIGTLHQFK